MRIPLHIKPEDTSKEADADRATLHFNAQQMTGGKGFRQPSHKPKRKDTTRLARLIKNSGIK